MDNQETPLVIKQLEIDEGVLLYLPDYLKSYLKKTLSEALDCRVHSKELPHATKKKIKKYLRSKRDKQERLRIRNKKLAEKQKHSL